MSRNKSNYAHHDILDGDACISGDDCPN